MTEASPPSQNDRVAIVDEGALHHYRTEIPNTVIRGIKSRALSISAKWLYVYLKSVAGDGGLCYRSTTTMALESGMSRGQVHAAKQELVSQQLITVTHGKNPRRDADRIRIRNIWTANMQEFSVHYANTDEDEILQESPREEGRSVHSMNTQEMPGAHNEPQCSPDGPQCSPYELGVHGMNARRSPEEDPLKKENPSPQTPPPAGD